jgi:hypothetical protein
MAGERFRVAYFVEIQVPPAGQLETREVWVAGRETPGAVEGRVALVRLEERVGAGAPAQPLAANDPIGSVESRGWLDKILQGRNRMDRILERAIRGKLVEPEDLLAMQASMYGYSKALSQIPPAPQDEAHPDARAPAESSFTLERDEGSGTRSLVIRLGLPPEMKFTEAIAELTQTETTSCQGIESRIDQAVAVTRLTSDEGVCMELELPVGLASSIESRSYTLAYTLAVTVHTDAGALHGRAPVELWAQADQDGDSVSSAGGGRTGLRRPEGDLRPPAGDG